MAKECDGTDKHGSGCDDPQAAIVWPVQAPFVIGQDRANTARPQLGAALSQQI